MNNKTRRERDGEWGGATDRVRRHTERERDRQTDRQTERETDRQREHRRKQREKKRKLVFIPQSPVSVVPNRLAIAAEERFRC